MLHKISTRVFMLASLVFGAAGIALTFQMEETDPPIWLLRTFMISIFVILPSFAFSVATKYLGSR